MDNEKSKRITKKIKVFGIVQGVGFRPLVYRIAKKYEIFGSVRNVGGYVEICVQAIPEKIALFLQELNSDVTGGYEIIKLEAHELPQSDFKDFKIIGSGDSEEISLLPPDLPVCPSCLKELSEVKDRRFMNPFISCMSCGPRYTILEELPYDRVNTTMRDFSMCPSCQTEYTTPVDRRFHAQTISCNNCGPYLILRDDTNCDGTYLKEAVQQKLEYTLQVALERSIAILKQGGILAVKGIGGYHLACSPFIEETVQTLRKLKGREEKPFAVMFESIVSIREHCIVSEEEKILLESKARPIVLLTMHKDTLAPSTNRGNIYCGCFLPYTPLQQLLIKACGPLIMTSANLSDQPIIREDEVMLSLNSPYLNGVLYNMRRIVRSVDDSVAKVIDGKPQLIRRSRGYVPYPVFLAEEPEPEVNQSNKLIPKNVWINRSIFAAGGDLKAAFCLYQQGNAVVSQYFGDLEEVTIMEEYKKSVGDLSRLLKVAPTLAVCDMHPNYFSSAFTKALNIPVLEVQHHHAHIASVMAEHDLKGRVIGIAFDGTGYGTDGNIWGGEFLICEEDRFLRAAHLVNTPLLGGDESMRDAKKTATCYLLHNGLEEYTSDDRSKVIKAALEHNINTVLSSSMGRLFDAVASILDIQQINRYEGECATYLEREAVLAKKNNVKPEELFFAIREESEIIEIDPESLLKELCRLRENAGTSALALGFHYALAEVVSKVCERLREKYQTNTIALSGGVFQNTILTEQTLRMLKNRGFDVFMNLAVPPNDGGISLGQTYLGLKYKC